MATFTAKDVQALRQATGAGMMDAKKALTEADGDYDKAVEILRVSGAAKAAKRADRDATNGLVASHGNALIQLAAETDFVAKNAEFIQLAQDIARIADENKAATKDVVLALPMGDATVADAIQALFTKIGEKLELANAAYFEGPTHIYLHRRSQDLPPQVGVAVEIENADEKLAHEIAMHIAAMSPQFLDRDSVPENVLANERHIATEIAKEEGKPEAIIPKIVDGRINGYFKENCLLEQASVSDDKKTVLQVLKDNSATVKRFVRFAAAG